MAGQVMEQREKPYPRAPITISPGANEPANHSCQCNHSDQNSQISPKSQDLAKLAAKLCKVMQACAVVPKDKNNVQQKYKYASSDAILEKANPAFVTAGLATVYELEVLDRQLRTTSSGAVWELVTARARLTIIDSETGATIQTDGIGQGYDPSDKAFSKAQTQSRKYALLLALNISTGEDPESFEQTDKAQVPPAVCKKCKSPAAFVKDEEFEGKPVKIYICEKCRTETRRPA
jgi:hypothetical protein